jgi:hypothetical protein
VWKGINVHSVKQQELALVPHERIAPSTSHFGQAVDATDQHGDICQADHPAKDLDLPERNMALVLVRVVCAFLSNCAARRSTLLVADDVNQDESAAHSHGDDLERDTRDNHLVAAVDEFRVLGSTSRSEPTANSLQHHGAEVAADEDPGIQARLDERVLRATVQDKVFQRQVDGGGDKAGAEDKSTDLELEAALAPGVTVHHDAADIADAFEKGADGKGDSVSPCLGHEADDKGSDEAKTEERSKEGVGAHIRAIAIERGFDGTFCGDVETFPEVAFRSVCGGCDEGDEADESQERGAAHGRSGHGGERNVQVLWTTE